MVRGSPPRPPPPTAAAAAAGWPIYRGWVGREAAWRLSSRDQSTCLLSSAMLSSSSLFFSPVVVAAFGEGLCGGTDGRREGGSSHVAWMEVAVVFVRRRSRTCSPALGQVPATPPPPPFRSGLAALEAALVGMRGEGGEEGERGGGRRGATLFPSFSSPPFSHIVLVMRTSVPPSPLFNRGLSILTDTAGEMGGPENRGRSRAAHINCPVGQADVEKSNGRTETFPCFILAVYELSFNVQQHHEAHLKKGKSVQIYHSERTHQTFRSEEEVLYVRLNTYCVYVECATAAHRI